MQDDGPVAVVASRSIEWRSRYDGLVAVAYIADKAVAGISGPWSGKFALTWWERPLPARQLELFDSMEDAQREVEHWALRMRTGGYTMPLAQLIPQSRARVTTTKPRAEGSQPEHHASLFDRVRTLFPQFARAKSHESASETIERLRRMQVCRDTDLSDLHFAASE